MVVLGGDARYLREHVGQDGGSDGEEGVPHQLAHDARWPGPMPIQQGRERRPAPAVEEGRRAGEPATDGLRVISWFDVPSAGWAVERSSGRAHHGVFLSPRAAGITDVAASSCPRSSLP
eukprot:3273019-Pyramimonas_sp.AAC.1